MPIRDEEKARYPKDWPEISRRIREREGNKCKWCKAPNGEAVVRAEDGSSYMLAEGQVHDATTGEYLGLARGSEYPGYRMVKIVLTVAHLNHRPEDCADDNLAALCQRCHNNYDMPKRKAGIKERARAKMAAGDLFEEC